SLFCCSFCFDVIPLLPHPVQQSNLGRKETTTIANNLIFIINFNQVFSSLLFTSSFFVFFPTTSRRDDADFSKKNSNLSNLSRLLLCADPPNRAFLKSLLNLAGEVPAGVFAFLKVSKTETR